ncbi:hypothetical protein BO70DRAFT_283188 [Aspergillus heteromorphus CBS 117.55]|uniref:AAA+ ATPase domain-containing protein n=1 Tax=Aspergillus heteromorphus CBS 117.55 TaxID=1448321 RepID=A0A317WX75_9EURO|nr:uncharacterized protein BO70DRAFT_283188 [Aspergillus heteromorphus CBS 117.55]PWY90989.1 hypothetical protein BO70DRAFT_283188 [Aspergillus heteromorphus CBS 117.55]
MSRGGWKIGNQKQLEIDDEKVSKLESLPERIRINSYNLRYFLNKEFGDDSLNFREVSSFSILRPFKMLNHLEKKIRARIEGMERTLNGLEGEIDEHKLERDILVGLIGDWPGVLENPTNLASFIKNGRCLLQFIDDILVPERTRLAAGPETVRFADLWFLYPRGSLVYLKDRSVPQKIWKVIQVTGGRRYLQKLNDMQGEVNPLFSPVVLDCFFLDYDGERFVPIYRSFEVTGFEGVQTVKLLPIVPLAVAEKDPDFFDKQALLDRGRQFVECTKQVGHLEFSGRSHYLDPNGTKLIDLVDGTARSALCYSERIDSEVMVDFSRALQAVPGWRPEATELKLNETNEAEVGSKGVDKDGRWDRKMANELLEEEGRKLRAWESEGSAPSADEDLLLLPDRVFAFVLSSRQWACLRIGEGPNGGNALRERVRDENPWEKLQLLQGHKELVQSLITSHFSRMHSPKIHFDLMKNKGNGVIILLHGVPGVGKTSTAECAAISSNKPLLPITCGDLGLTPGEVEDKLKEVFRLAQEWGCIMLLDEADVFLAQRSVTDTSRNALVSVFLRTLEYYEGILFLTTNRVGVFDEAFKSRIHMALYYPPLTSSQTVRIWQRHIDKAKRAGINVNEDDLLDFADKIYQIQSKPQSNSLWNGRQIRNAFQSAVALAAFHANDGPIHLERKYFQNVFHVSDQFSTYIWTTKNYQTDADRSRLSMVRRDNFEYQSSSSGEPALQVQQQQSQPGSFLQSTYGQDVPRSIPNFGGPKLPQGGNFAGGFPYSAQTQQFENMPAAAMRPGNNLTPGGGQQFNPTFQSSANQVPNYMMNTEQQLQYAAQQTNFRSAGQQGIAPPMQAPLDQPMFATTQMTPQ